MSAKLDFSPPTLYGLELANSFHMLTAGEYFVVRAVAHSLSGNSIVVNIGAGTGTTSLSIAETLHDANIFTIDISPGGPLGGLENEYNAFKKNNFESHLPTQHLMDSQQAGDLWVGGEIDMLIIDADHSERGCRGDFEKWYRHVKDNGYILFHDYDRDVWPDVKKVVDSLDGIEKVILVDTMYVARKNKFLKVDPEARPRRTGRRKQNENSNDSRQG